MLFEILLYDWLELFLIANQGSGICYLRNLLDFYDNLISEWKTLVYKAERELILGPLLPCSKVNTWTATVHQILNMPG